MSGKTLADLKREVEKRRDAATRAEGQLESIEARIREMGLEPDEIDAEIEKLDKEIDEHGEQYDELLGKIERLLDGVDEEDDGEGVADEAAQGSRKRVSRRRRGSSDD